MHKKRRFNLIIAAAALVVALAAAVLVSCTKEDNKCHSNQSSLTLSDNDAIESKGNANNYNSIHEEHGIPLCITEMMEDPEFESWDFERMYHDHSLDTSGFFTYIIPCRYADTELLCLAISGNTIINRFALSLPLDFDYEYYYNEGIDAWVEAQSYNYKELYFSGWLNFRNQTIYYAYVNEKIYGNTDLTPLGEWRYMNLCQRICIGVETAWYVGFNLAGLMGGGLPAFVMAEVNSWFFGYVRKHVCI